MPPGNPHVWHLGNDIVDLADPRHEGKCGNLRFLRRVLSDSEVAKVRESPDPDQALWIRWAGKEAAFKTISKSLGTPPVFVHAHFQVTLHGAAASTLDPGELNAPVTRFGLVHFQGIRLPLRIEVNGRLLHALTWTPHPRDRTPHFSWGAAEIPEEAKGWKASLEPRFSPAEWDCITHRPSALTRLAARGALAGALGISEEALEIRCGPGSPGRRIPRVFAQNEALPVDLTLSHHGRFLAWAFLIGPSLDNDGEELALDRSGPLNPRADT